MILRDDVHAVIWAVSMSEDNWEQVVWEQGLQIILETGNQYLHLLRSHLLKRLNMCLSQIGGALEHLKDETGPTVDSHTDIIHLIGKD